MGILHGPSGARVYKIGRVFRENGILRFRGFSGPGGFGDNSGVEEASTSKQDRGKIELIMFKMP